MLILTHTDVISHRGLVGCPKVLLPSTHSSKAQVSNKEELAIEEESNPFAGIISDGEDSANEEEEEEGER